MISTLMIKNTALLSQTLGSWMVLNAFSLHRRKQTLAPESHQQSWCRDEWTEILPQYNVISSPHLSAYNLWPTGQVKTILHANTMSYIMHYRTANAFKHRPLAALVIGDLLTWVMRVSVPNVPYSRQWLRSEKSKKVLRRKRKRERAHLPGSAVCSIPPSQCPCKALNFSPS